MKDLFTNLISKSKLIENKDNNKFLFKHLYDLSEKTNHLQNILEYAKVGLFLTSNTGEVLYINSMYEEMTGLKREDILHRDVRNLVINGEIYKSTAVTTIERRKSITAELFFETTKRLITISTTPIFDDSGELTMVVGSMSDTTELMQMRESFLEVKNSPLNRNLVEKELDECLKDNTCQIIARDIKMLRVLQYASKVSNSNATVLITGETGVGKEELTHFIHGKSSRKNNPLVEVNCVAIPETLIESELFGHEGGAFTGAKSCGHKGFFEQANGGTLFLDEVGELPLLMQSKLLKAIQERKIVRVGGTKAIDIDVRLIAATNQDLKSMVSNKQFRPDLFYRLNVVPITIPPLRERKNDIIPLALHFLSTFNDFYDKNLTFSSACLIQLQEHHWPGNIRELKNLIERACVTCESNILTEDMLFESQIVENDIQNNEWKSNLSEILEKTEYNFIREYYDHYKSVRKAAEALGMDRSTFNRKKLAYEKKYKSHI